MAMGDNITKSLGIAASAAETVADVASAALARAETLRADGLRTYNTIVGMINAAGLEPAEVAKLISDLNSDFNAGGTGRNISAAIAGIMARLQDEKIEKETEEKQALAHQAEASQEFKREAGIVTRTMRAVLPKALIPHEEHSHMVPHEMAALRDDNHEYSFASMVKSSTVVATTYLQKKIDSLKSVTKETVAYVEQAAIVAKQNAQVVIAEGGAALDEASKLADDVTTKAGTGFRLAKDVILSTARGDLDVAAKRVNLIAERAEHFMDTAGLNAEKSIDNIGDVGRDVRARFSKLGSQLDKLLPQLQQYKQFDTDHDGKVELHEITARMEKAGVKQIKDVNGNGLDIEDVRQAFNSRIKQPTKHEDIVHTHAPHTPPGHKPVHHGKTAPAH